LAFWQQRLAKLYSTTLQDKEEFYFNTLVELINEGLPTEQMFGTVEATAACKAMEAQNTLMLGDDIVYKI
jgi:DNA replication licensing factor MCM3